jgi:hypothetical protein
MGWQSEHSEHEGYVVGFVTREGCSPESGLYRELMSPADNVTRDVEQLAAGCDCGWRSPRWFPSRRKPAHWWPHTVAASEEDEERVHELWRRHLALDVDGDHRAGASAARPGARPDPESRRS